MARAAYKRAMHSISMPRNDSAYVDDLLRASLSADTALSDRMIKSRDVYRTLR